VAIKRDNVRFRILERLCTMPKRVRGISGVMLGASFRRAGRRVEAEGHAMLLQKTGGLVVFMSCIGFAPRSRRRRVRLDQSYSLRHVRGSNGRVNELIAMLARW